MSGYRDPLPGARPQRLLFLPGSQRVAFREPDRESFDQPVRLAQREPFGKTVRVAIALSKRFPERESEREPVGFAQRQPEREPERKPEREPERLPELVAVFEARTCTTRMFPPPSLFPG